MKLTRRQQQIIAVAVDGFIAVSVVAMAIAAGPAYRGGAQVSRSLCKQGRARNLTVAIRIVAVVPSLSFVSYRRKKLISRGDNTNDNARHRYRGDNRLQPGEIGNKKARTIHSRTPGLWV